jgi:hypothetical protein
MEGGHWKVMETLMRAHETDKLGAYFLPGVAQQGKLGDLEKLMALIDEIGCEDEDYVIAQISSAMISAALTGNDDMLLALSERRESQAARKKGGESSGGGGSAAVADTAGDDRSEL